LVLEVDEQPTDFGGLRDVSHRKVHAVAVVVGKRNRALVHHAHKARFPALVGAIGPSALIYRREKEHVQVLDEGLVLLGDMVLDDVTFQPVREPYGVELLLESAMGVVIEI
jgi:hypothetical protein